MNRRRVFGLAAAMAFGLFAAGGLTIPLRTAGAAESAPAPAVPTPGAVPDAADILFETPQLATVTSGQPLVYRYARKTGDPELGPSFEDRIRLTVGPSAGTGRDVWVDFFSGERHRAAGPFENATTNPVLMLILENHVADLSGRLKGNPRYFKNAIRAALRDKASVTPASFSVDGRTVTGWRVTVSPFKGDANATRMRGLDTMTYTFEVAPDLPGAVAGIQIAADAPGGRLWEESIAYDPKGP